MCFSSLSTSLTELLSPSKVSQRAAKTFAPCHACSVTLLSFLPGDISLECDVVMADAPKSPECCLIFEDRKLLTTCCLTGLGTFWLHLETPLSTVTDVSSAIGYQLWELIEPELESTLHPLLLLLCVPSCFQENTHIHRIVESASVL